MFRETSSHSLSRILALQQQTPGPAPGGRNLRALRRVFEVGCRVDGLDERVQITDEAGHELRRWPRGWPPEPREPARHRPRRRHVSRQKWVKGKGSFGVCRPHPTQYATVILSMGLAGLLKVAVS